VSGVLVQLTKAVQLLSQARTFDDESRRSWPTAPAASVNLCFDHDNRRLQAICAFARLFFGEGDFAARSSNAIASQNCFGLILVNLHQ